MYKLIALVLYGIAFFSPAMAAEKSEVARVVEAMRKHPSQVTKGSRIDLTIKQGERSIKLVYLTMPSYDQPTEIFGIQTSIVVGAKESDYSMDTPCPVVQLTDYDADGTLDEYGLECIAWTPKLKPFMNEQKQRIFNEMLQKAADILKVTQQ